MNLLALSHHSGVRLAEVGFVLGALAGLALAIGAMTPLARQASRVLAGLGLAVAFLLLIIAAHWGHFN
jgi:hypothetical protein